MSPKSPRDVKTNSTILGQLRNVSSRNIVVPIGYGRLRLGSALISNYINVQSNEASGPDAMNQDRSISGSILMKTILKFIYYKLLNHDFSSNYIQFSR